MLEMPAGQYHADFLAILVLVCAVTVKGRGGLLNEELGIEGRSALSIDLHCRLAK